MELSTQPRQSRPSRPARPVASECWVYTPDGGLREAILACGPTTLIVDGQPLRQWCLIDRAMVDCALAIVYAAEPPSRELRERVTGLARLRFANRSWFRALSMEREA